MSLGLDRADSGRLRGPLRHGLGIALVRTARPAQWPKNLLVLAAPAASGTLLARGVLAPALAAAAVFTIAASATYFVNDAADVDADRAHPEKRHRPVAAGLVGRQTAYRVGLLLAAVSLAAAAPLGWGLTAVAGGYLALTLSYSRWLKAVPVVDILAVAGGFVLRAVAGALVTGLALSDWFLLVTLFGSLFLVAAKRAAERRRSAAGAVGGVGAVGTTGAAGAVGRRVLAVYPPGWLDQVMTVALTGSVIAYAAWAFQYVGADVSRPVLALSAVPFLAALLRYSLLTFAGGGEAPEHMLTDRFLVGCGLVWALLVGAGLYLT
ncbi:decaprenyl-phosphate phosphoribosyltransferase [Georgenia sp. SYP-B2076]|uniref:decaprenyl-phosphate phosphoribosyltransferase n=1 Tax=Georgenia sp. SYP-B2076 TaxID=2495881 RepID=UPI000F8E201B|nr:decaprenyl-phosphate phosphoribosyltransferase [Georgenia sp. SYP-B2076]